MVAFDPYSEIRGSFPVNRKRKVLGTIPVTLNLKEGTMKVGEFLDKDSLRVGPRQEEKMELKPIDKMDDSDCKKECFDRMGLEYGNIWPNVLKHLRENDIGTENLKPPEPEWKRWRKWPACVPNDFSGIEMRIASSGLVVDGFFIPYGNHNFHGPYGSYQSDAISEWRYLEEPPRWKVVTRDGNPSEAGWYEILPNGPYRRFRYWEGKFWNLHMGGEMCGDPIAYHPIAPAPKFKESNPSP